MKSLKLEHNLAQAVRNKTKTVTWRMYDDKDIRVNDRIELIDKVDPKRPASWQSFGVAKVNAIVEKRLNDITQNDFKDQGQHFVSKEELLDHYKGYYGDQVSLDTPVKMICFTLQRDATTSLKDNPIKLKDAKLYADGGSRGNPGPSASGYVVLDMDDKIVVKNGVYLGVTTNNQAEYQALKLGLEEARKLEVQQLHVFMDSLLVINQLKGVFKVKNRDLWPIYQAIKDIASQFRRVTFTHVPRELNKLADGEVNVVLDARAADTSTNTQ